jgi:hypothetical protein
VNPGLVTGLGYPDAVVLGGQGYTNIANNAAGVIDNYTTQGVP